MKKKIQFDENHWRDSNGFNAFKDLKSLISINKSGEVNEKMKEFING